MRKIVLSLTVGGLVVGAVVLLCAFGFGALLVIRALWAWVVSDLFPGAVADGLVAGKIGWWTAGKLAIVVGILGVYIGSLSSARKTKRDRPPVCPPAGRGADAPDVIDATDTCCSDDEQ